MGFDKFMDDAYQIIISVNLPFNSAGKRIFHRRDISHSNHILCTKCNHLPRKSPFTRTQARTIEIVCSCWESIWNARAVKNWFLFMLILSSSIFSFFLKYCPWVYMHGSFHTLKIQLITYFPPLNFRKSATKWVDLSIASSILDIQIVCVSFSSFTFDSSLSLCGLGCFFWHENCERTKKKPNKTGKKRNVFVCYVGNQIKTIMCTWWYKRMQSLTLEFLHALHPHLVNSHTQLSIVCCTSPNTHSVCVCLFSHFVSTNKKTRISMLIT